MRSLLLFLALAFALLFAAGCSQPVTPTQQDATSTPPISNGEDEDDVDFPTIPEESGDTLTPFEWGQLIAQCYAIQEQPAGGSVVAGAPIGSRDACLQEVRKLPVTGSPPSTPDPTSTPDPNCNIKGNISSTGGKIYHMHGQRFYNQTIIDPLKGERWFCTEQDAQRAGWRKSQVEDIRPTNLQPASVLHVIDGDTIEVDLNGAIERVRYAGIDTPEKGERCAVEAAQRNATLVDTQVMLEPSLEDRDKHGRLVRYVWTQDGRSVDQLLLQEGLARAWYGPGTHRAELIATAEEANALFVGCLFSGLK